MAQTHDFDPDDPDMPSDGDDGELETVEIDGRLYHVPGPLKAALERGEDHGRQSQALAEHLQALEAQWGQASDDDALTHHGRGRLAALDDHIGEHDDIDWDAWDQIDPGASQSAWRRLQQAKDERGAVAMALAQLDHQRQQQAHHAHRQRLDEGHAILARDIAGWSPELGAKLMAFGGETFGFSPEELAGIVDPRLVKVLHAAFDAHQNDRTQQLEARTSLRPVTRVGAGARAGFDAERAGIEEWMRHRNGQLRRRR